MLRESTFSTVRNEYHENLQNNVHELFELHDILPSSLETHRYNVDFMTS